MTKMEYWNYGMMGKPRRQEPGVRRQQVFPWVLDLFEI
jgi:hypothetical protein